MKDVSIKLLFIIILCFLSYVVNLLLFCLLQIYQRNGEIWQLQFSRILLMGMHQLGHECIYLDSYTFGILALARLAVDCTRHTQLVCAVGMLIVLCMHFL